MKYNKYLEEVATKFNTHLREIAVEHNFEHGDEFEIAICKTLDRALPSRYAVCRGYLVDIDSDDVGDDIIIYDHERFPALRLVDDAGWTQLQRIPIEAAYAYIEAKNSLTLTDVGSTKATFPKAVKQVQDAKSLVAKREPIDISKAIVPNINMRHLLPVKRQHWTDVLNPFFTGIIARHVRKTATARPLSGGRVRWATVCRRLSP